MRMRHQLIVTIAVVVATAALAANAFAQNRVSDQWNENKRAAVVAAWAQPVVVPTTIATAGDTSEPDADGSTALPDQDNDNCVPLGQIRRGEVGSDKDTPPGQEKDRCPPGLAKDKDTPPGLNKDDNSTPPGQAEDKATPPGLEGEDKATPPGLEGEDKDTPPGKAEDKSKDKDD